MSLHRTVLTVDAGGSKTDIAIARVSRDAPPLILARYAAPAANVHTLGVQPALEILAAGIAQAMGQASAAAEGLEVAVLALAGAAQEEIRTTVEQWCEERQLARRIVVMSDAELILTIAEAAAEQHQASIALIAGTGSVAFGRRENQDTILRAGGWGPLLGDDGGGFWIGRRVVRMICRDEDRDRLRTPLAEQIFAELQVDNSRALIARIGAAPSPPAAVAALARTVLAAAVEGDPQAQKLVNAAGKRLIDLVRTVANRLDAPADAISMACTGGLLSQASPLAERLGVRDAGSPHRLAAVCRRASVGRRAISRAAGMSRAASRSVRGADQPFICPSSAATRPATHISALCHCGHTCVDWQTQDDSTPPRDRTPRR